MPVNMDRTNTPQGSKYNFDTLVRESPLLLVLKIIMLEIIAGIVYAIISWIDSYNQLLNATDIPQTLSALLGNDVVMTLIFFFIQILITFYIFFAWYYKTYDLRNQELYYQWGVFVHRNNTYVLKSLEYVKYEQSFFAAWFNYGHVVIKDVFMNQEIRLNYIDNPRDFTAKIEVICGKSSDSFLGLMSRK